MKCKVCNSEGFTITQTGCEFCDGTYSGVSEVSTNLPVNWQETMAAEATAVAKAFRPTVGQISTKSGILGYMDQTIPQNKLRCIILASIFENNYFEGKFDPKNPRNPICYAFGKATPDGSAPFMAPPDYVVEPHRKAADCVACPYSKWGSDVDSPSGKGKRCKEIYKLALVPAATADADLSKTEIAILRVPVTSRKNFELYVNEAASVFRRPTWGMVTEVSLHPHMRNQFEMKFNPVEAIPDAGLSNIYPRISGGFDVLMQKYEENTEKPKEEPASDRKRKF